MVIVMTTGAVQAQVTTKYNVHGGCGYDTLVLDIEVERILGYALAYDLLLFSMCLKKLRSHLITCRSGNTATQIDFVLFQKSLCKTSEYGQEIPQSQTADKSVAL